MLQKISRYLLVVASIIILAHLLPSIYNTLFDIAVGYPSVTYSIKEDKFFLKTYDRYTHLTTISDVGGRNYTEESFFEATPVSSYFYLETKGKQPDSIKGVKIDKAIMNKNEDYRRLYSSDYDSPSYHLFPLFESKSGLKLPEDVCRISENSVDFIEASTNRVIVSKSEIFTKKFNDEGFNFPPKIISGIPTIMKKYDNGYFIVDKQGGLFHFKMEFGKPFLKEIKIPETLKIRKILPSDVASREIQAFLISEDNKIFVLSNLDYNLIELPIYDYDPANHYILTIRKNVLFMTLEMKSETEMKVYALDRNYKKVLNTYYTERKPKSELAIGKVYAALFPFDLKFRGQQHSYIKFIFDGYKGMMWAIVNLFILTLYIFLLRKQKRRIVNNCLDILLVAFSGIFGFIAVNIFQNKEF